MSITLPAELADLVRSKVEAGGYASESDVVRDGLLALQERDAVDERWVLDEVAPIVDRHRAEPSAAAPLADVVLRLDAMMRADATEGR